MKRSDINLAEKIDSVTITEPDSITILITSTDESCDLTNGSATADDYWQDY